VNAGSVIADEPIQLLPRGLMSKGMDQLAAHQAALQAINAPVSWAATPGEPLSTRPEHSQAREGAPIASGVASEDR